MTTGLTLDAGALIALDSPSKSLMMLDRLTAVRSAGGSICVPVEVIAQAWRSPRQVRLARLLNSEDVEIVAMTPQAAKAIGTRCASSGHADVVDVHVALCARARDHAVVTSDPDDFSKIDPSLPILTV